MPKRDTPPRIQSIENAIVSALENHEIPRHLISSHYVNNEWIISVDIRESGESVITLWEHVNTEENRVTHYTVQWSGQERYGEVIVELPAWAHKKPLSIAAAVKEAYDKVKPYNLPLDKTAIHNAYLDSTLTEEQD